MDVEFILSDWLEVSVIWFGIIIFVHHVTCEGGETEVGEVGCV
jgi:hypothetical protein